MNSNDNNLLESKKIKEMGNKPTGPDYLSFQDVKEIKQILLNSE